MPGMTVGGMRKFSNEEKREFLRAWHEAAGLRGERAELLRSWQLASATVRRWVEAEDAGRLGPAAKSGRFEMTNKQRARLVSLEQENARLRRQVEQAEAAMTIMGKAHELLQQALQSDPPRQDVPTSLMSAQEYQDWLQRYGIC